MSSINWRKILTRPQSSLLATRNGSRRRYRKSFLHLSLFWVGWFVGLAINAVVFPTFERTGPSSVLRILEFLPFATQNATQVANIATSNIILSENRLSSTYYGEPCWVRTSDLLIKSVFHPELQTAGFVWSMSEFSRILTYRTKPFHAIRCLTRAINARTRRTWGGHNATETYRADS